MSFARTRTNIKLDRSLIKACAIFLFVALTTSCAPSPEQEREDLKKELSETKAESTKLQTELSTLKKLESAKEKKLAEPGEARTTVTTTTRTNADKGGH